MKHKEKEKENGHKGLGCTRNSSVRDSGSATMVVIRTVMDEVLTSDMHFLLLARHYQLQSN